MRKKRGGGEELLRGWIRLPEYIASWLKVLGGDKQAIFTVAAKATGATNYMSSVARPEQSAKTETVDE